MLKRHDTPDWAAGPIVLTGNWEPLIFRRRVNAGGTDLEDRYRGEHTEAMADRLKDLGVNLLITHYFKGFGLIGEAEDIECAHRLIEICHDRGIRVGGYIGDTLILETVLAEQPDAAQWCQRRHDGRPLTYGGTQTFRHRWCRNNPAALAYIQSVVEQGIRAGLDMLHFDNFVNRPEPESCHCPHCVERFREYLIGKYPPEIRKQRLGFADCSHVQPPWFCWPLYDAWRDDQITNPLLQEWIDFQCQALADTFAELGRFCRSLNPDVAVECNPTGIWYENAAYLRSIDHARVLPAGDFFWDESPNRFGLRPNGALFTHVSSMKMGQALGNRCFTYAISEHADEPPAEVKLAEALAFNRGCLGMVGGLDGDRPQGDDVHRTYAGFLHQHAAMYCQGKSMARAAVYRNFASLAFNSYQPHLQVMLTEQALLRSHVPFDLIFDPGQADGYDVLILPGCECLSAEQIALIEQFAEQGGFVVVVGRAGRYDVWRREYPQWPMETHRSAAAAAGGRWAFVEKLALPDGAPGPDDRAIRDTCYPVFDEKYHLMPANADALLGALAGPGWPALRPYRVRAPQTTLIEPRRSPDGDRMYIHVVNYDPADVGTELPFGLPATPPPSEAAVLAPGRPKRDVSITPGDGHLSAMIPNDTIYSVMVITH